MMKKFMISVLFAAMIAGASAETSTSQAVTVVSDLTAHGVDIRGLEVHIKEIQDIVDAGKAAGLTKEQTLQIAAQYIENSAREDDAMWSPRTKKILLVVAIVLAAGVVVYSVWGKEIKDFLSGKKEMQKNEETPATKPAQEATGTNNNNIENNANVNVVVNNVIPNDKQVEQVNKTPEKEKKRVTFNLDVNQVFEPKAPEESFELGKDIYNVLSEQEENLKLLSENCLELRLNVEPEEQDQPAPVEERLVGQEKRNEPVKQTIQVQPKVQKQFINNPAPAEIVMQPKQKEQPVKKTLKKEADFIEKRKKLAEQKHHEKFEKVRERIKPVVVKEKRNKPVQPEKQYQPVPVKERLAEQKHHEKFEKVRKKIKPVVVKEKHVPVKPMIQVQPKVQKQFINNPAPATKVVVQPKQQEQPVKKALKKEDDFQKSQVEQVTAPKINEVQKRIEIPQGEMQLEKLIDRLNKDFPEKGINYQQVKEKLQESHPEVFCRGALKKYVDQPVINVAYEEFQK